MSFPSLNPGRVFRGGVLLFVTANLLAVAGCAANGNSGDLERRGFRPDRWYTERHERVVQRVFDRENRVEVSRDDLRRYREGLKQIWLRQQRRRLAARQRQAEHKSRRRGEFLVASSEKEGRLREIRAERDAATAKARLEFQAGDKARQ